MRIGLFIPCFIDAFFPEVGIATLELLERFGHEVVYPRDQTCFQLFYDYDPSADGDGPSGGASGRAHAWGGERSSLRGFARWREAPIFRGALR
jgi:hypothetical protein